MYLQPECVYGGTYSNLSSFRRHEIWRRRFTSLFGIILVIAISAGLVIGYLCLDKYCTHRDAANDTHRACIATTIASIENSDESQTSGV